MIRPFGLQDIGLVRRLQRSGMSLAIEHMLTHPHEPLWTALTAPWPWAGVGVATFVFDKDKGGHRLTGFAQLMKRASRSEADLLHIAPALLVPGAEAMGGDGSAQAVWRELLDYCALAAASHGLQRIYASTPEDSAEQAYLKRSGFCLYARETIYRLACAPSGNGSLVGFRKQRPQDGWALQRLYARTTPRLIQQSEGAMSGEAGLPLFSWWEPDSWQGIVWEPAGEVRGAVQVHLGRAGHWLRILGGNELAPRELRALIEQGLRLIDGPRFRPERGSRPVYIGVRDYEMSLGSALHGFGFAPYMDRVRLVKHTVALVRDPLAVPRGVAAREMRHELPVRIPEPRP